MGRMIAQADRRAFAGGRIGPHKFTPMEKACLCVKTSTADIAQNGFIGWYNGKSQVRRVVTALGRLELHEPRRLLSRAMRLIPDAHGIWDDEYPSVDCATLAELDRIAAEIGRLEPLILSRLVAVFRTLPYDGVEKSSGRLETG